MNTYKKFLPMVLILLFLTSCHTNQNNITDVEDYNLYLQTKENNTKQKATEELNFWEEKLEKEPSQYPYLAKIASAQSQMFHVTGDIDHLIYAEESLIKANKLTNYKQSGYLRALSRNYISQHKFKEALELLKKAESHGDNLKGTQKMLFDVYLELGEYELAKTYLYKIKDVGDFDYLIRLSKWSDHQGNLQAAIKYMEQAMVISEASNIASFKQWTYTNMADFYGHDGQIEKSYSYYLKALALNPDDAYAKKGIAWIVYSSEKNPDEALRILNSISENHQAPDYYLFKAEIAEYQNNLDVKDENLSKYFKAVANTKYGQMYNAYNAILYAEDLHKIDEAFQIAHIEIKNRPTPQSYDLLAWTYYNKGNYTNALSVAEEHVVGKTFEPEALFHLAKIYKANGKIAVAEELKKELLESTFELGPVMEREIHKI
ncbi:tetratricopeptide repeat protein [Xanthomarina sp. F2636L]|uniref:tetratricopeptide repeat protein n=1 Tax=Xanthomarina sp. F2636L TaxID=2996018 RepID=UPI00225E2AFE|nr:cell surface protein [Xanthomarina sp. F2636L]MCX7550121.1 cell surface protein [Xanthomarina sp. F2636L]